MIDIVVIGKEVITWLLSYNEKRTTKIDGYVKRIRSVCEELVEIDDPTSDRAALLHEQLKVLSDFAAERLPKSLLEQEGWNLYRGLSSARIYYWLRVVGSTTGSEFERLISERRVLCSASFDALLKILPISDGQVDQSALPRIKGLCLQDIARMLEIRPFA